MNDDISKKSYSITKEKEFENFSSNHNPNNSSSTLKEEKPLNCPNPVQMQVNISPTHLSEYFLNNVDENHENISGIKSFVD